MARRKKHEEHENHERWLVSYADFITLLFAFFTVMYATSQADEKKQEKFEKSVRQQFASFGVGMGNGMPGGSSFGEFDTRNNRIMPSPFENFPPRGAAPLEVQNAVENRLEKTMSEEEKEEVITGVRHERKGVRIQLAASKFFTSGSADIRASSLESLDKVARILKESGREIVVEGHTDDEPIKTERFPSNWELSAARATKIVRYLILRHGIPASQLKVVAYADQKPLVPNSSEENRAKNRRIEIMIMTSVEKE
jgi:chemotaxis protein MotB